MKIPNLTIEQAKDYIASGRCPFCESPKTFKCLSNHTCPKHGISASKLREMFGLNLGTSTCIPELAQIRSENIKKIPLGILKERMNGAGWNKGKKMEYPRLELLENRKRYAKTEEHISFFKGLMAEVPHEVRVAISSNQSTERRRKTSLRNSQMAEKLRNSIGEDKYKERMSKISLQQSPEVRAKATRAMQKAHKEKMKDPEYKKRWMNSQKLSRRGWMKIPYEKHSEIIKAYNDGKSQKELAQECGVSKSLISLIILGKIKGG